MDEPVLAWYFASADRRTLHGASRLRPGGTEFFSGELVLGHRGLHASRDPIDALIHGHGPIACRVELAGARVEGDTQLCATQRTVTWLADASELLRSCARDALREHVDADLEDETALRRLLQDAREDVEERFDRLRDGEWKKHERGEDVELEALREDVEAARVRARLLDAAVRSCSDRFEALRSVYEDLRLLECAITVPLDSLPHLNELPQPSSHPLDPIPVEKGPLHDVRDELGRELGKIRWITRAGYGVRHPDGASVLFIEAKPTKKLKPRSDARIVMERIRALLSMNEVLVVLDRAHAFRFDLQTSALFTDGSERTACDPTMLEQLGELLLVRVPVAAPTAEPERPAWRPRLKEGPVIRTPLRALERLQDGNAIFTSPPPLPQPTTPRANRYEHGFIGEPIAPLETTSGLSVWSGKTYRQACKHARAVLPMLDDPRPAVLIERVPRPAVRVREMPALETLRAAATRVLCGSTYWSHETERVQEGAVRKLGRTAAFPTLTIHQTLPLADDAVGSALRAMHWVLAAWFIWLRECGGCVGIEVWRRSPVPNPTRDACEIAEMWRSVAGPARMVVVFREASPPRWVFVDREVNAHEISPLKIASRSLCYLAG